MRGLYTSVSVQEDDRAEDAVRIEDRAGDDVLLNRDEVALVVEWLNQWLGRARNSVNLMWKE